MLSGIQVLADKFREWKKAKGKDRSNMVQEEVRRTEEAARQSTAVEMGQQGACTKWEVHQRKVSFPEIWRLEPYSTLFSCVQFTTCYHHQLISCDGA